MPNIFGCKATHTPLRPLSGRRDARWLPRLGVLGPVLVGGEAGAAQSISERAARRGLILTRRRGALADIGASGRSHSAAATTTDLVIEAQRQRDPLPRLV